MKMYAFHSYYYGSDHFVVVAESRTEAEYKVNQKIKNDKSVSGHKFDDKTEYVCLEMEIGEVVAFQNA